MNYQHYDLKHRSRGEIVEVTISGNAPNVRLMDSANFSKFRRNGGGRFYGGQARKSPVRLPIPHSGHWYVVIDFGGLKGSARTGVCVLPGSLPPLREAPLSSVPSLVHQLVEEPSPSPGGSQVAVKQYDVFISHASEDKDNVVRPLAHALRELELEVWYDEFELRIGDSLRRTIDKGVANSRFGVVVLSEDFFKKGWPNYELDGLVTKGIDGEQVILPVWHNISKAQVIAYSPSLADKLARSTSTHTVEDIAAEIAGLVREEEAHPSPSSSTPLTSAHPQSEM